MVKRNKYMNVPEIRFKGLDKTWNKKTLDELVQLNSGMDYKHLCNGNIPVYGTGGYMLSVNAALSYDKDAIGIGRKGTINKPYILKAPFWTVDTLFYAIPRKYNNLQFCNCIFQRIDWLKYDESTGVPSLSKNIINSIEVNCAPSYDEQQKIASYFQSLDSLIQTTSKKLVSLKQIKDASLQSMFPQEGETVPKVRFKGFEGEWDFVTAGEVFRTTNVRNRPDLPVLSATQDKGMVKRSDIGYQVFHDKSNETTYKHILPGQFIIHLRSFQGGFAHSNIEGIVSPAYTVMEFKNKEFHYDYFWKYIFTSKGFIKRLELITYGIRDGRTISFDEFKEMNFFIPSKLEQQKIASYFCNLDKQISLQTQRLEKLKQIKAACLDKMFV